MLLKDLRIILNLMNTASDDPTRYNINGVYCNKGEAVSTDGHVLAVSDVGFDQELYFPKDKTNIMLLKTFIGSYGSKAPDDIELYPNKDNQLVSPFGPVITLKTPNDFDIRYPNYKQFIPNEYKQDAGPVNFGFNPLLLEKITKAMGLKKGKPIKFNCKDAISPIRVTNSENTILGVLMPVRV